MNRIEVVSSGKQYIVLVDFCQRGVKLNSPANANSQAKNIQEREMPHAELYLINVAMCDEQ